MRLLCAAAVSLSLGLFVALADDKKPADPNMPRADKFAAAKKKFDDEMAEFKQRLAKASDAGEARGIQAEMRELVALRADKFLDIAKDDPKDDTGFAALEFLVKTGAEMNAGSLKEVGEAVGLLAEHHAASPKIKPLLVPLMRLGPAGEKLIVTVSEKGTDKEARGTALFIRGFKAARAADDEEDEKLLAEAVAKAIDLFDRAAKEAPDAKVGTGAKTIAEFAKQETEQLKAISALGVGKPAPDVESYDLGGKKVKLSDYKGKVVLLDMWATWCGPCRAMIPHERELVKKFADKPFLLVSVSADDKKETLEKFMEKEAMPWVHWWDEGTESPVLRKFRVKAFPTLYLIDHTGVIRKKWVGIPGNDPKSTVVDEEVDKLVKEALKVKG